MTTPHLTRCALLAAGAVALGACAGGPRPSPDAPQAEAALAEPSDSLFAGAARERIAERARNERSSATDVPLPPGVDPARLAELGGDERNKALTPLGEVLDRFRSADDPSPEPVAVPESDRDARDAMRLYVAGRRALLAGEVEQAVEHLTNASELAPGSGVILARLGDAQLAAGQRAEAVRTLRRAYEAGSREPGQLVELARHDARRNKTEEAARLYVAALDADPDRSDVALPVVIRVGLGETLHRMGYLGAGNALLRESLELPSPAAFRTTNRRRDITEVYRRRADLWRRVGDAECRMGRYADATDAYRRSVSDATLDSGGSAGRELYALLRQGRRAGAMLRVLESLDASGGLVDNRARLHLSYVAVSERDRSLLARALDDGAKRAGNESPSIAASLVRAGADLAETSRAREMLRERIASRPLERPTIDALFATYDTNNATGIASEGVRLVRADPRPVHDIADSVLAHAANYADLMSELGGDADAERLLRAALLLGVGNARGAYAALETFDTGTADLGALAPFARIAFVSGETDHAEEAIDRLLASEHPGRRIDAARSLAFAQDTTRARSIMLDVFEGPPDAIDADAAIFAAEVSANMGLVDESRKYAELAIRLDPYEERSYRGVLLLHQAAPSEESAVAATETIRRLRERLPASRALREVGAREAIQRGRVDEGERELLRLSEESLSDAGSLNLLTQIWERAAQSGDYARLERGEAWLRERLADRPEHPALLGAMARLLVADARADEADTLLKDALDLRPSLPLARLHESVLRNALGRQREADDLAAERLRDAPRTPAITIELAGVLLRAGRTRDAADALAPLDKQALTLPQQTGLLGLVRQTVALTRVEETAPDPDDALALIDQIVELSASVPPDVHQFRLNRLIALPNSDPARIVDAANLLGEQHPELRNQGFRLAAGELVNAERGRDALLVFAEGGELLDDLEYRQLLTVQLAGNFGDAEGYRTIVDRLAERDLLVSTLDEILRDRNRERSPSDMPPNEQRAEVFYAMALVAHGAGREDAANDAYELAIEAMPRHIWANNNLAYALTVKGERLDDAERMLAIAYEQEPDDGNIIDSLGWVRYKLGQIEDVGPRPGAVTLLGMAARSPKGMDNMTILDHYGDALWVAGREDEAIESWRKAATWGNQEISVAGNNRTPMIAEMERELDGIRSKLRDAEAGREPQVADTPALARPEGGG